jgi:hypothetical protein
MQSQRIYKKRNAGEKQRIFTRDFLVQLKNTRNNRGFCVGSESL